MIVVVTAFQPTQQAPFQFNPTLDGASYLVLVTWNLYGQRWYVTVYTLGGVRVLTIPMVGSPADYDLSLTDGYFATELVFRQASQSFEVIDR